jgi:hypothetical protein
VWPRRVLAPTQRQQISEERTIMPGNQRYGHRAEMRLARYEFWIVCCIFLFHNFFSFGLPIWRINVSIFHCKPMTSFSRFASRIVR